MDGNRRWADQHDIPRIQGHETGLENLRRIAGYLNDYKVKYATFFVFSTENWDRPRDEVEGLMDLLKRRIDAVTSDFDSLNMRLRHLGNLDGLPESITTRIRKAIELTKNNTGITLNLAFNYGGRAEIVSAARRIIKDALPADKLDEKTFSDYLYTAGMPDVDLLIRTGGELRVSNFLIWQSAYAEYFFSDLFWPDFDKTELDKALFVFSQRQRRFGRL
jgi:undecaprenyl diphosphate synthase